MSYLTLWKKLRGFLIIDKPKISIIIPFTSKDKDRVRNFKWLIRYWKHQLPDAEIIIGESGKGVFCKGQALNRAVRKSHGRVLAIMDADALLKADVVEYCADRILEEQKRGYNLWYIPYRHLFRLNQVATKLIIRHHPKRPYIPKCPPPKYFIDTVGKTYGYRYCAMAFIIPRKAWDLIGGFDERFRGWGSEDVCLMRTLDTVFGKHKTTNNCIYHLYHPIIIDNNNYYIRKWDGQDVGNVNASLSNRYLRANRNPTLMWQLIAEDKKIKD